jgi:hypothetical protein
MTAWLIAGRRNARRRNAARAHTSLAGFVRNVRRKPGLWRQHEITLAMLAGVLINYALLMATSMAMVTLMRVLRPSVLVECSTSKTFRARDDVRMLYPPIFMPFGMSLSHAVMLRHLMQAWAAQQLVAYGLVPAAVVVGLATWAVTAGHGIFIDYCSYRVSFAATLFFMVNSAVQSVVSSIFMLWYFF